MQIKLLKHLPVATALYAIFVFGSATAFAQISTANNPEDGIWVKLCATGTQVFIPFDTMPGDEEPMPAGGHSQACHACADRRIDDSDDGDNEDISAL